MHTSMPHSRTCPATFFASGQSSGVPTALQRSVLAPHVLSTFVPRTSCMCDQAIQASSNGKLHAKPTPPHLHKSTHADRTRVGYRVNVQKSHLSPLFSSFLVPAFLSLSNRRGVDSKLDRRTRQWRYAVRLKASMAMRVIACDWCDGRVGRCCGAVESVLVMLVLVESRVVWLSLSAVTRGSGGVSCERRKQD